jgi:NAD-dependent deacetylase
VRLQIPGRRSRRARGSEQGASLEAAQALLREARHLVALTGAGISTRSGIPDFRNPDSGLWNLEDPMEVASIWAFRRRPDAFFEWVRPLAETILTAMPNPAHTALAELERMGRLRAVITQNIDDLHRRAGSQRVLELHGHLREATCITCYRVAPGEDLVRQFVARGELPHCPCGGVMKPNVILFGEMLPQDVLVEANRETEACDLMLVAGSSLEVAPACDLPMLAIETGSRLVIVNLEPTRMDDYADVVIRGDVAQILPSLV